MHQREIARQTQENCRFFKNIQGNHQFHIKVLKISSLFLPIFVVASQL